MNNIHLSPNEVVFKHKDITYKAFRRFYDDGTWDIEVYVLPDEVTSVPDEVHDIAEELLDI